MNAQEIIEKLELMPLAMEGGYFKETYRCSINANTSSPRSSGTCIYYMLTGIDKSAWHKVEFDEIWIYSAGTPAVQMLLFPDGRIEERIIGADIEAGEFPQSIIPAGTWQAAVLKDRDSDAWGLFSAVVVPGFEYKDYTDGDSIELASLYPGAEPRMHELGLF